MARPIDSPGLAPSHPDELTLNDFSRGMLTQSLQATVVSHVEGCARCRELLVELGRSREEDEERPGVVSKSATAVTDRLIGTLLGEYRVLNRLSQGGMGLLYRGEQPEIGKRVAIKVLLPAAAEDPELVGRLLGEARAVNAIRHPNIIDIFSFGRLPDGRHYFVMELLEGSSIYERVGQRGAIGVPDSLIILEQAAAALEAAHAVKVIHRDLKPANLFLTTRADGVLHVTLLDFGLAKQLDRRGTTSPNVVLGTPGYMAPEQIRGHTLTAATDIYSLGVVAFYLLAGRDAYDAPSAVEILLAQLENDTPRLKPEVEVPQGLENLVARMMAKKALDRPSASEVRRELGVLKSQHRSVPTLRQSAGLVPLNSLRKTQQQGPVPLGDQGRAADTARHRPPSAQSATQLQIPPEAQHVTQPEIAAQETITDDSREAVIRQTVRNLPVALLTTVPDREGVHRPTDVHRTLGAASRKWIALALGLFALGGGGGWWFWKTHPSRAAAVIPLAPVPEVSRGEVEQAIASARQRASQFNNPARTKSLAHDLDELGTRLAAGDRPDEVAKALEAATQRAGL